MISSTQGLFLSNPETVSQSLRSSSVQSVPLTVKKKKSVKRGNNQKRVGKNEEKAEFGKVLSRFPPDR